MSRELEDTPRAAHRFAALALALGAFAQLAQILIFREIMAICHGTEILFGVVLAANLGWTAAGTALASWLASRDAADGRRLRDRLATLASLNGLLMIAEILLARALAGWGNAAAGQTISLGRAAVLSLLITSPVALISGCEFALALRAVSRESFSALYRAECWGAVFAGLGFTFLFVHIAGPIHCALTAGGVLALTAGLTLRLSSHWSKAFLGCSCAFSALLACFPLEQTSHRWCWQGILPGYEVLEVHETPYGRVAAVASPDGRQVSLFHNGAISASFEPTARTHECRPFADLCACLHPRPRTALLVGGALDRLPVELLRHGLDRIDAVELDPALFDLAQRYGKPVNRSPVIHLLAADGRALINCAPRASYDLIIVSAGEPDTATANRYYTAEFFAQCRRCLSDEGVLVLILPTYGSGGEYTGEALAGRSAVIWHTLWEVFADVRAAPIHGLLFAAAGRQGIVALDPAALGHRLAQRSAAAPNLSVDGENRGEIIPLDPKDYFEGLFGGVLIFREDLDGGMHQQQVESLELLLQGLDARVNRDTRSAAVTESLLLNSELRDGRKFGKGLVNLGQWSPALAFGGFLVTSCIILRSRRKRTSNSAATAALFLGAFVTGIFGMAVPIAILNAYQNIRGCVYQEVGALMAFFMAGLALGARLRYPHASSRRQGIIGLLGMLAFTLALPASIRLLSVLPGTAGVIAGFWLAVLAGGFLDGMVLSALVASGSAARDPRWSGKMYMLDLLGAGAGALICGSVWLPLLGLSPAMFALAALILATLLTQISRE